MRQFVDDYQLVVHRGSRGFKSLLPHILLSKKLNNSTKQELNLGSMKWCQKTTFSEHKSPPHSFFQAKFEQIRDLSRVQIVTKSLKNVVTKPPSVHYPEFFTKFIKKV